MSLDLEFDFKGKQTRGGGRGERDENIFALVSKVTKTQTTTSKTNGIINKKQRICYNIFLYDGFIKKFRFLLGDRVFIAFDEKRKLLAIKRTTDPMGYCVSKSGGHKTKNMAIKFEASTIRLKLEQSTYFHKDKIIEQDGVIIFDLN